MWSINIHVYHITVIKLQYTYIDILLYFYILLVTYKKCSQNYALLSGAEQLFIDI